MFGNQSLIHTRIIPPRRRKDLVERKRLIQLLGELVEKRLVLVSAPAGYGKTTLLVDFLSNCQLPVCWYTIDRLDFDPLRFISYLAASIQQRFPGFGKRTEAVLSGDQGKFDGEYIATVMINDIYENISEHFLIVLDDYHLVNDSLEIRKFMSRLMMDLDENCHFILGSRTLLSLPDLPLLVARSEVGGLSYEELEFIPEEIQQLYQQNQLTLISLTKAKEIQERTEGWVTGIVLTSQVNENYSAAQARINRVSGFSLEDYFSQIIDQFPDDLRSFLLWTSLLEEFNAKRCEEVLGPVISLENAPWQKWINTVQQNNLFTITVGEHGEWLRYHQLFLEFLQNRISREQPEEAVSIQNNLAKIYIANGEWDQAFSIYRHLNSQADQVSLIEKVGLDLILNGRISTLSAWLDSLPIEVLNTQPFIVALQGNVAMVLGNTTLALSLFNRAINAIETSDERKQLIVALSMRAAAFRVLGKLNEAKNDANEILLLVDDDRLYLKYRGEALRIIGLCDFHQGKLHNALQSLESALKIMDSIHDQKNIAIIQLEIGVIHEHLGNYDLTKNHYLSALTYWKSVENPFWLSNIHNNLGVLHQLMGEYKEASSALDQALGFARSCGYVRMEAYILTGIGDIFVEINADDQAINAYNTAEEIADRTQEHFLQIYIRVQRAALTAYGGDYSEGYKILQSARNLVDSDKSEMELNLIELEYSAIKIQDNRGHEVSVTLEKLSKFFELGGHKVQFEKTHLYLALAYISSNQPEKVIEHILHLISSLESSYPSATLMANFSRYRGLLKSYSPDYLQKEYSHLIKRINEFNNSLPSIRRELWKNTNSFRLSQQTIYIRSFGRMEVKLQNQIVTSSKWQTQAARDLFYMLLAHPEGLTKDEISLVFWPDASFEESKFRFKNTLYRLRRALRKDCIILVQNVYMFNNKVDYEYDVELFLRENALANQVQDPVEKLSHYREALKYYRGDYLPEIAAIWVLSPREYLRQINLNILLQVSTIYFNQSNYDLAMDYCQRAITEDNLLEDAYRLSMKIYAAMGNRAGLVQQYQRCVEVFDREINASPSTQTFELFQYLKK
jgi:ATP/maltotriose-dependent transcriptional regulator MalT/DNA-binding SARP family transcriptional activator